MNIYRSSESVFESQFLFEGNEVDCTFTKNENTIILNGFNSDELYTVFDNVSFPISGDSDFTEERIESIINKLSDV